MLEEEEEGRKDHGSGDRKTCLMAMVISVCG